MTILNTMSTTIILSTIILACFVIICYLLHDSRKLKSENANNMIQCASAEAKATELSRRTVEAVDENIRLNKECIALKEENSRLLERIRYIEEDKSKMLQDSEMRFKILANEILSTNSRIFKEQNESRLTEILTPLKENIEAFKKAVNDSYTTEARERFSLQEKIKELIELNQSIGKEAKELTTALKGNSKIQGDWGEMILENILEKSGLQKGREYQVQQTTDEHGNVIRNENGDALRPDVVINYPGGRCVVIDSKVSLNAYVNYVNADTPEEQETYAKQHLQSVRKHIGELRQRKYQDYIGQGKTDFVMMFIPNEAAFLTAMQLDNKLWQEAYDVRVLLVSPTQLISALRLVAQLWSHDRQTRNAIEIANAGGRMYDKFVGFIDDMRKIEKTINLTHDAFNSAMTKLSEGRGNLVSHAEKMRTLGAKATKALPDSLKDPDEE